MPQAFDVCIRGAGIAGQTLALLLARERLRVALVRPDGPGPATGQPDVRAYALNVASRQLLESVRAWPEPQHATAVRHMQVQTAGGGQVAFDAAQLNVDALTWIVDVPALEARLQQAVSFQSQIETVSTPQTAALTVICEGKASQTRAELGVQFERKPYGQTAIATRLNCQRPHRQTAYQWFADGDILAFLPLDGVDGNSMAVVWSVATDKATQLLVLPEAEFADLLLAASLGALGELTVSAPRAAWPLFAAQAAQWVGSMGSGTVPGTGSWALVGDAAHAVHPLAGQGLNLGLEDVAELAKVLQQKEYWRSLADLRLLRRYERARSAALWAKGGAMDGLQQAFTRPDALWQTMRDWGMQAFDQSGPLKRWLAQKAMGLV